MSYDTYGQPWRCGGCKIIKTMTTQETTYRLRIDGVMYYEDYPTADDALKGARAYFSKDHSLRAAEVIKYTTHPIGMVIYNKDYGKEARI